MEARRQMGQKAVEGDVRNWLGNRARVGGWEAREGGRLCITGKKKKVGGKLASTAQAPGKDMTGVFWALNGLCCSVQ